MNGGLCLPSSNINQWISLFYPRFYENLHGFHNTAEKRVSETWGIKLSFRLMGFNSQPSSDSLGESSTSAKIYVHRFGINSEQ